MLCLSSIFLIVSVVPKFIILADIVLENRDNSPVEESFEEKLFPQQQKSPEYLKLIDLCLNPNTESNSTHFDEVSKNETGTGVFSDSTINENVKNQSEVQLQQIADKLNESAVAVNTEIVKLNNCVFQLKNETSSEEIVNSTSTTSINCKQIYNTGQKNSDIYVLQPKLSKGPFLASCEMGTREGGWTVIQSRFDGSINFNRSWQDYRAGFGDLRGEFWLGLDYIHELTGVEATELYIELEKISGEKAIAYFEDFKIESEEDGYRLTTLKGYSGTVRNSLDSHIGMKFSTFDKDQDTFPEVHCAQKYGGGWWFHNCYSSHLNGIYRSNSSETGIAWAMFGGVYYSLAKSRIMIR